MNIKIEKYDNEGRGIGYYNKKIVFIPGVIVGEVVKFSIVLEKDKYIIGKLEEVVSKSNIRIKEKCPFYDKCGGCSFLHLSIDEEIRIKYNNLVSLFKKEKLDVPDIKVINSDNKYNYRNKITLKIKDHKFGYYNDGTHDFVNIDYCYLVKDSINNIISNSKLFDISDGEIIIRSNYNNELIIKIVSDDKNIRLNFDKIIQDNKVVGIIVNDKIIYGDADYIEKVNKYLFKVNINSFFQVNLGILEKISEILGKVDLGNVVDLYCGVGTLGMFVNKSKLYGIEIVPDAIKNAIINSKMNKQDNLYMLGDSSKISKINNKIDSIIVDPPRSGINKETMKNIVNIKPDNIVYMSCNPITFVRDMKVLSNLYDIKDFYALDMFPRTKHVETVCILERK